MTHDTREGATCGMTDRFVSPETPPEGLERELLTILAEECCEVGQRVSKALRFGLSEVQPGQSLTNAQRIALEAGDLIAMVKMLEERGVLDRHEVTAAVQAKRRKVARFLQSTEHAPTTGG